MNITGHLEKYLNQDLLTDFDLICDQFDKTADFILKNCLIL